MPICVKSHSSSSLLGPIEGSSYATLAVGNSPLSTGYKLLIHGSIRKSQFSLNHFLPECCIFLKRSGIMKLLMEAKYARRLNIADMS